MGKYDAMTFSYDECQGPAPLFAVFHFIRWGKHPALQDNVTILTFQTIYFLLDLSSSSYGANTETDTDLEPGDDEEWQDARITKLDSQPKMSQFHPYFYPGVILDY